MYRYDQRPGTQPSNDSLPVIAQIRSSEYSVLVGRNNCGKSFLLKTMTQQWGENASYLGPARYQNFNLLGLYSPNRNRKGQRWRDFLTQWQQQQQNIDNSPVNLQQSIAELSDKQRDILTEIIQTLLGVKIEIRQTIDNNSMSQKYISCGGHNLSFTSSGVRLIMTLITSLLDTDFDTYLIDEPELGISPEAQGILSDFLFDRERRAKYFPHIKTIVFATHSTIFLDHNNIANNYTVEKKGDEVVVRQVETQADFNRIHFFLLGNRFETLYLPSAIVLVEGKCDYSFIERLLALKYPDRMTSIIHANSDARIKELLNITRGIFADIQKSPYHDRIFIILDAVHSAGLPSEMERMGVPKNHIVIWPKNGIEYYYPPSVMEKIFGASGQIQVADDIVSRNGISYNKMELVQKVISHLDSQTPMHDEFAKLFLALLDEKLQ